jgi:hypothetical protein
MRSNCAILPARLQLLRDDNRDDLGVISGNFSPNAVARFPGSGFAYTSQLEEF